MTDLRKAAEMALEALEWNYGTDLCDIENCMAWLDKMNATIQTLRQALAQPEQEPVAWVYNGILHEFDPSEFATSEVKPLYTAPPKREWVGLTRRELDIATLGLEDLSDCYKAIEAKLKEKNT